MFFQRGQSQNPRGQNSIFQNANRKEPNSQRVSSAVGRKRNCLTVSALALSVFVATGMTGMLAAGLPAAAQTSNSNSKEPSGGKEHGKEHKETSHKSSSHKSDSSGRNKTGHSSDASTAGNATKGTTAGVSAPTAAPVQNLILGTKPDLAVEQPSKTLDSPMQAVGGAWKMLVYLLPILLIVVGGLALLRRFHERNGSLPLPLQAMARRMSGGKTPGAPGTVGIASNHARVGTFTALLSSIIKPNISRERAGSSIRVLESTPLSGANLHLVEVRGRVLLLGVTGMNVSVLTDFKNSELHEVTESSGTDRFRNLLQAASLDMDDLDFSGEELPAVAVVASMEDHLRETSEALERRAQRLRTTHETQPNRGAGQDGEPYV